MKRARWQSAAGDATIAAVLAASGWGVWRLAAAIAKRRTAPAPKPAAKGPLAGRSILFLATDGFEESELVETRRRLAAEGAWCVVAAPAGHGTIRGERAKQPGASVAVDCAIDEVVADAFDALVLPGGVVNADALRMDESAIALVKRFASLGRTIAAICHAPWLLIEAGLLEDAIVTSWPSLKHDLANAGAKWVDRNVVVDGALITSRKPQDIPAFVAQIVESMQREVANVEAAAPAVMPDAKETNGHARGESARA